MGKLFLAILNCRGIVRQGFIVALAVLFPFLIDAKESTVNSCPALNNNYDQVLLAAKSLRCAKGVKKSKKLKCLPQGLEHQTTLSTEYGNMGLIAESQDGLQNYYIFNGTKFMRGPSLLDALSMSIFKSAELEKVSRLMYKDLVENKPVIAFGHSQGSLSAQVAAYFALKKYYLATGTLPTTQIQIITFGSPGNWGLLSQMDPLFDLELFRNIQLTQIISSADPVPKYDTFIESPLMMVEKFKDHSLANIYDHMIRAYSKKTEKKLVCMAEARYPYKYKGYFENEGALVKLSKNLRDNSSPNYKILKIYEKEKEACYQIDNPDQQNNCLQNFDRYNSEIEQRLRSLPATQPFTFNPLKPVN